jgi:hypothetical protein
MILLLYRIILLYRQRCKCKEEFSITKPKKRNRKIKKYILPYLKLEDTENEFYFDSERFEISYKKNLSSKAKFILNTFQKKYIYYAIDDILYLLKSNPSERNNLLGIIYSPIISLQNNFSVNFFDIWIDVIYIQEIIKKNRFLNNKTKTLKNDHLITITLFYKIRTPVKKQNLLW